MVAPRYTLNMDKESFQNSDTNAKFHGAELPVAKGDDWVPDKSARLGIIRKRAKDGDEEKAKAKAAKKVEKDKKKAEKDKGDAQPQPVQAQPVGGVNSAIAAAIPTIDAEPQPAAAARAPETVVVRVPATDKPAEGKSDEGKPDGGKTGDKQAAGKPQRPLRKSEKKEDDLYRLEELPDDKKPKGYLTWKKVGWAEAMNADGTVAGYIFVYKRRYAGIFLPILAGLLVLMLIMWATTGVAPQNQPAYLADQAGITQNNKDIKASIDYASYQSTPDQTWAAGQTHQDCTLSLPKDVYTTGTDGNEVKHDNPVLAAPHIYVDLNADGKFEEDECVFNPITYDDDGNVTDYGSMLEPGNEITSIDLTQALEAGTYDAQITWTPVMAEDTSVVANPMTFDFKVTVR